MTIAPPSPSPTARPIPSLRIQRRDLINQAIENMPEGEALLTMMKELRRQIEKKTGKHLLLADSPAS